MRSLRNILVPLDGSPFAESVLPLALDLARRAGARVTLATVHTPPLPPGGPPGSPFPDPRLDAELRADVRAYLDLMRHRLARESPDGPPIEVALLEGAVADAIADHVRLTAVDLVVLGSHGRGGVSRLWLGSVTDALVRRLDVPTLVVHPDASPASRLPPTRGFRRVLLPVDGTPAQTAAVEMAADTVGALGVAYTLLHVVSPVPRCGAASAAAAYAERDGAAQRELVLGALAPIERTLRERGAETETLVRFHPSPAEAILAVAAETGADLIALGTHARGPIGRLLLGSVTDKVLRGATVPVLVRHRGAPRHAAPVTPPPAAGLAATLAAGRSAAAPSVPPRG